VLRSLIRGSDEWMGMSSGSSSSSLESSDSALEASAFVRARVRSAGPWLDGLLGSQRVPSSVSGSTRVALPRSSGFELRGRNGAVESVGSSELGCASDVGAGTSGFEWSLLKSQDARIWPVLGISTRLLLVCTHLCGQIGTK
jgi:hypothetical protein